MINIEKIKKAKGYTYDFKDLPVVDGDYVKKLRNKLNMSQSLFAELLSVTKKTVEKWEQGKNPVTNGNKISLIIFDKHPEIVKDFIDIEVPNIVPVEPIDIGEQFDCLRQSTYTQVSLVPERKNRAKNDLALCGQPC